MPNPHPGGPGYPFLSGSSPLTCLAWEALPVAYTTASIALWTIQPHKSNHYTKVGIRSGDTVTVGDEKFWYHYAVAKLSKRLEKFIFHLPLFKKVLLSVNFRCKLFC